MAEKIAAYTDNTNYDEYFLTLMSPTVVKQHPRTAGLSSKLKKRKRDIFRVQEHSDSKSFHCYKGGPNEFYRTKPSFSTNKRKKGNLTGTTIENKLTALLQSGNLIREIIVKESIIDRTQV